MRIFESMKTRSTRELADAQPQARFAPNPVKHTRTCNKLRTVNWFTGEVR